MKIFVINLDGEVERMAFQSAQLNRLNLNFERSRATQIDDLTPYQLKTLANQWERPMRPGEVACMLSHQKLWREIAQGNDPALILEDDALLSDKTTDLLATLSKTPNLDHATLECRSRKKLLDKNSQALGFGVNLTRLYQDRTGAAAYILWPKGAKILLQNSKRAAGLADAIIAAAYAMSSWQVEPAAAIQLDQCTSYAIDPPLQTRTTIGTSHDAKPIANSFAKTVVFKARRVISQMRMGLRQLSVITISRRRLVTLEILDFHAHIPGNKSD